LKVLATPLTGRPETVFVAEQNPNKTVKNARAVGKTHLCRPIVVRRVSGAVQRVGVGERLHETVELRAETVFEVDRGRRSRVHRVPLAFPPLGPPVLEPNLRAPSHKHRTVIAGMAVLRGI